MHDDLAEQIQSLNEIVTRCKPGRLVFLGGAGVSTESGIPDFRSAAGIYHMGGIGIGGIVPPETILSRSFFDAHPKEFFDFYFEHLFITDATPNAAHTALAELERRGIARCVVTQNIDGLHTKAGSHTVYELHGSVHRNRCMACGNKFDALQISEARAHAADGIPRCPCGGTIKPDVVLYEEPLDERVLLASIAAIGEADVLIVAGTSLAVYPAAGLTQYFSGNDLVLINLDATPLDRAATLRIHAKVGEVMGVLSLD